MHLYALSDLHLNHKENRRALATLPEQPDDWLILGGDLGEREEQLRYALDIAARRFARVVWIPGNHELWTLAPDLDQGEERYLRLVEVCREYNALTPEDPFPLWPGEGPPTLICPLFVLYDYSFRPEHVTLEGAIPWAVESGVLCNDERYLRTAPYAGVVEWCRQRTAYSIQRLEAALAEHPDALTTLINHFPMRYEHVRLWRIPRFSIWCGTRATEDWHRRFRARAVVYGHLHIPRTDYCDGTPFVEVSVGYPAQWSPDRGIARKLKRIF